jgi:hypothetical protein
LAFNLCFSSLTRFFTYATKSNFRPFSNRSINTQSRDRDESVPILLDCPPKMPETAQEITTGKQRNRTSSLTSRPSDWIRADCTSGRAALLLEYGESLTSNCRRVTESAPIQTWLESKDSGLNEPNWVANRRGDDVSYLIWR